MVHTYSYPTEKGKEIIWYDLENPTHDEVRYLMEKHNIDPLVAEELLSENVKPKVDVSNGHIYLVLHFPYFKHRAFRDDDMSSKKSNKTIEVQTSASLRKHYQEIDFIIGKEFLVTTRYDSIEPFERFAKLLETGNNLTKRLPGDHAGFIFYRLLKDLYNGMVHEIDAMREALHVVENKIFHGDEKNMVYALSRINRDILTFKESTNLHKSTLESLQGASKTMFGESFDDYIQIILNEYYKSHTGIQESKEFLDELRKTNDSLLQLKQNETVKTFNALAFIFLPPSFVLWLFSIRSPIPFLEHPESFWIIAACLLIFVISLIIYFRKHKWL